jgi:hypothetical protein
MHVRNLEDKLRRKEKHVNQTMIDEIKLLDVDQWENTLTDKDRNKIRKRNQDQRRIIKRLLESDIGLVEEFEL